MKKDILSWFYIFCITACFAALIYLNDLENQRIETQNLQLKQLEELTKYNDSLLTNIDSLINKLLK